MQSQNRKVAVQRTPLDSDLSSKTQRTTLKIAVVSRQQNADEQNQFKAATDALLTEMVRQQLGRRS